MSAKSEALEANHAAFIEVRNKISDDAREADIAAYGAYLAEMRRIEAAYGDG